MKKYLSLLFLLSSAFSFAQPQLITQEIGDEISMLVPAELTRANPAMQRSTSPALAMFITTDGQTDLAVNYAQLRWGEADPKLLSQFYKANILNLYDQVNMLDEGIKEINGRAYIYFEFSGDIVDEPNAFAAERKSSDYTYIMYTIQDNGVLIFRFTSPASRMNYWRRPVAEVMQSITFSQGKKRK